MLKNELLLLLLIMINMRQENWCCSLLKNRLVLDEHFIFIYLSHIRWPKEHTSKVIQCKLGVKAKCKLPHNETGQKIRCKANNCATRCKPEAKKPEDSRNTCVCFYRSLKILPDDHSDFVAV